MKLAIVVITDVATAKVGKRRFIEVRGLFCYDDKKYSAQEMVEKAVVALKQYAEEKGYDKMFVEYFEPEDFEFIVGVEDIKDVDKCDYNFEFEVCDKKYGREGGFFTIVKFPSDWVSLSSSEIRMIIHSQVPRYYEKSKLSSDWKGYSVITKDFMNAK